MSALHFTNVTDLMACKKPTEMLIPEIHKQFDVKLKLSTLSGFLQNVRVLSPTTVQQAQNISSESSL